MGHTHPDITFDELSGLLDSLVAIDFDLRPLCAIGHAPVELTPAAVIVADARAMLHQVIRDLAQLIHRGDGGRYLGSVLPRYALDDDVGDRELPALE